MKRTATPFFIQLLLGLAACSSSQETDTLRVAVAANAQFAMEELTKAYEQETQTACELIIGSSGKLTAQIKEGAPFDVFISADMNYPQALFQAGKAAKKPQQYCRGQLVLWTLGEEGNATLTALSKTEIEHIALANPALAPYGKAAEQVLKKLSIYDSVEEKLVFGESIAQTNQFVYTGSAAVGFTAKSVVVAPNMQGQGHWNAIPDSLYAPIEQGLVILNNRAGQVKQAEGLVEFIFSVQGQAILSRYGYLSPQ